MTARELTLDDVRRDKDTTFAWLHAHDLDPGNTAPGIVVRDGTVTAVVYKRNEDGHRYIDETTGGVAVDEVEIKQRLPLPEHLGTAIE